MSTEQQPFDLDRIGGRRALRELVDEVLRAGEEALRLYREGAGRRVVKKPDRSPVTEADQRVEEVLRTYLARRHPTAGFLGEETGGERGAGDLRFVVDPIDGTRAFIRGLPTWSVLVGLEADGVPAVGIAFLPAQRHLLVGVRGDGAEQDGRPLTVSEVSELSDALITHGGVEQFARSDDMETLAALGKQAFTLRGLADFEGYRQVLMGVADAMVDPGVKPWDVCPAAVLVREAGGRFTSMAGDETIHGGSGLASNGRLHAELLDVLRSAGQAPTS